VRSGVSLVQMISNSILHRGELTSAASVVGFRTLSRRKRNGTSSTNTAEQLGELAREHDRKTALLYTASHEVRGSMHGILGLVERLRECGDSANPALLDALGDACSGLRTTVQQVLDVAQLEDGESGSDHRAFDLRAVLREVSAVVSGVATREVSVHIAMDESCEPMRFGNAGRVNQILTNVAINGAKATARGSISIEVRAVGPEVVRFVIRDQGEGMPAYAQDRLTGGSPSWRRRASDNPQPHATSADPVAAPSLNVRGGSDPSLLRRGSGLGLLIARELVELLDGRVEVSVQWGSGTNVLIDLPLPPVEGTAASAPEPEVDTVISRTLIVDDAPDGLEFLSNAIRQICESVDATEDSAEALDFASEHHYDLVIVDGMMAPHDGADLAREMRRLPTTRDSVIIVATGNVETVSAARYLAAGADLVLVKPFSRLELLRAVRRATADRPTAEAQVIDLRTDEPEAALVTDETKAVPLSIFSSLLEDRLAAIAMAYDSSDVTNFCNAVHALGSPAVMLGIDTLGRCCLALETLARALGIHAITPTAIDELHTLAAGYRDLVAS
jgi:two-component system, NarL family, sensor histidine kinase EvgS